jgi:hypothetical protein
MAPRFVLRMEPSIFLIIWLRVEVGMMAAPKHLIFQPLLYSVRFKTTVIARRFLPKQSLDFQQIASLRNARNDDTK